MFREMRLWRSVTPDIANTSPPTYSCLIGELSSNLRYSSTVIARRESESPMATRYARRPIHRNQRVAERCVFPRRRRAQRNRMPFGAIVPGFGADGVAGFGFSGRVLSLAR